MTLLQRCKSIRFSGGLLLCLLFWLPASAQAPASNLAIYQDLALRCLAQAPDTLRTLRLEAPEEMPYLRTALTAHWQREGRTIFLPESNTQPSRPQLQYAIEAAEVDYVRSGRKRLTRTVTLILHHTLTAQDGRLLHEARCPEQFTDTIRRAEVTALQIDAFPETVSPLPGRGWLRRYLEPAALTAATAITAYLFFSLRTDSQGNSS